MYVCVDFCMYACTCTTWRSMYVCLCMFLTQISEHYTVMRLFMGRIAPTYTHTWVYVCLTYTYTHKHTYIYTQTTHTYIHISRVHTHTHTHTKHIHIHANYTYSWRKFGDIIRSYTHIYNTYIYTQTTHTAGTNSGTSYDPPLAYGGVTCPTRTCSLSRAL